MSRCVNEKRLQMGGENRIYLKWNDRAGELGEHLKRTARQRKAVTEIKH